MTKFAIMARVKAQCIYDSINTNASHPFQTPALLLNSINAYKVFYNVASESWANCCSSSKNTSSGASRLKREGHIGQFANQIYSIISQVLWNCLTWVRQEVSSSEAWFLDIESYCANLKRLRYWPRLANGGKCGLSCLLHLFLGLTPALRLCTLLMQDSTSDTFI